jgi:hypothetical protein
MHKFLITESVRYSVRCSGPECGTGTGNSTRPDSVETDAAKRGFISIFAAGEPVANFCPACIPQSIAEIIQGDAPEPETEPETETAGELFEKGPAK